MLSTFKYQYTSPLKSLKLHVTDNRSFLGKQNCGNSPGRSHEVKQKSSGCIALLQELFRSSQEVGSCFSLVFPRNHFYMYLS